MEHSGDKAMYTRIVTATVSPGKVDEAIQLWRDTVLRHDRINGHVGIGSRFSGDGRME
jgi:hypothetical protein